MDNEEDVVACLAAAVVVEVLRRKKARKKGSVWVKCWLAERDRKGAYNNIISELKLNDREHYRRYLRMDIAAFEELVKLVTPTLQKKCTRLRKPLSVEEKLACTLRFLATGESYSSLQYQFRISKAAISLFIPEVCSAIYRSLKGTYLKFPETDEEWVKLSDSIYHHWQFPNSIGAMDGKHIAIFNQPDSGSLFYNYKGFYSVVLLALVKHNYQFLYVNVGCQGRMSDGGVFKNTDLYKGIISNKLNLPAPRTLPKTGDPIWDEDDYQKIPFMIVGDDAFQLSDHMMKPYKGKFLTDDQICFNYRLSRFRRCSENAFGIFVSRFRLFLARINVNNLVSINKIILAGIVLHNMLCEKSRASYMPNDYVDQEDPRTGTIIPGQWRETVPNSLSEKPNLVGCRGTR